MMSMPPCMIQAIVNINHCVSVTMLLLHDVIQLHAGCMQGTSIYVYAYTLISYTIYTKSSYLYYELLTIRIVTHLHFMPCNYIAEWEEKA